MKKRFLSFLLTLTMLLTLVVLPAGAETTLTLDSYNIITNAIRLEFSNTITEAAVSVSTTDGTALAAQTPSISANIVSVTLSEKMDIEKSYVLDFTVTDGANTLTAEKLIEFTVHWNDDFESYNETADLDSNYIRAYGDSGNYDAFTNLTSSGLDIDAETNNKRLKISSTWADNAGVWINKSGWKGYAHGKKYYTLEADFEVETAVSNMWMRYNTSYMFYYQTMSFFTEYFSVAEKRLLTDNVGKDTVYKAWGTKPSELSIAVSTYKKGASDAIDVFYDGNNRYHNEGTLTAANEGNSVYGIMSSYGSSSFYVDNWKIYTASLADYVETGLKYCNVTTKAIQLVYNNAVNTESASVTLKNGAIAVNTTSKFDTATNTLVITPETVLDLNKAYSLNVTGVYDEAGIDLPAFSKTFEFETLWYDDFDSYDKTADLDEKYQFVYETWGKTTADAPEFSVVKDTDGVFTGSNVLKMESTKTNYAIAPKFSGYFALGHSNNYYTLEFDARTANGCWEFDIPMYQTGDLSMRPYMQFLSATQNMYIRGLLGFDSYADVVLPKNPLSTIALTVEAYDENGDFEGLFYDGVPAKITTDKSYATTAKNPRHFAFKARNEFYIDNLKAYRVKDLAEIPEGDVAFSDAVIDSEKITLTYDADVTADVSVTADSAAYAVDTAFENNKIVIKPANSAKFDMNKQYDIKVTKIADKYGRLAPDYEKKFRFKLIWEDDFSTYNAQTDLDSKYFIIGGYGKPSEIKNTENDYLYKLDAENDRLILNGTDGITSLANQSSKQFIMPVFNPDNMSLNYWKDYSFEYTLSKDTNTYYRVESYYNPWVAYDQNQLTPSHTYNWIYYGIWGTEAAQIIIDGNSTAKVATPAIAENDVNMKILIGEDEKVRVYKGETELYENATNDWKNVTEGIPFMFRNAGEATDKYYLDNLIAYKVIFIDDNDLYLTNVSYSDNKVTAYINVTSDEEISDGKVFIAAYDEECKLVGVSETSSLILGEAIPVEISNASNVRYVKAFAWGDGDLKPLFYTDLEAIK